MEILIFLLRKVVGVFLRLNLCKGGGGWTLGRQSSLILCSISKEQSSRQRCPPSFPCNKELPPAKGWRNGG